MIDLAKVLAAAERIRPLPGNGARLTAALDADDPDFSEVIQVISDDPALALLVLRVANSVAYGGRRDVATVAEAVLRLGTATLAALGVGSAARSLLNEAVPAYNLSRGELWRQAITASVAADEIRRASPRSVPAAAVTAALLHDIGKLVLGRHLPGNVLELLDEASHNIERFRAESELLGVHQAELGALIACGWRLPRSIVMAIHYQAAPGDFENTLESDEPTLQVCRAVHLAIFLAARADAPSSEPPPQPGGLFSQGSAATREAADALGLTELTCLRLLQGLGPARDARLASYG